MVVFYSSSDCSPGTEIGQGNEGCIEVDGKLVGAYRSFDVIQLPKLMAPAKAIRERRPRIFERAPEPEVASYVSIEHGQYGSFNSINYRWQQIGTNSFVGILLEEWNNNVHVQIPVDPPTLRTHLGPANITNSLEERNLFSGVCQVAVTCAQAARAGGVAVADVAGPYFNQAKVFATQRDTQVMDFLQKPFFTQVTASK